MNRAHRAGATIGSGLAAAALALGASLPAQASSGTGWRVVSSQHYAAANAYNGLLTVVAPRKKDAWALGGTDLSEATAGAPVAEQWNGTGWQAATLPSGLTSEIDAASAPGPKDIWAVSHIGGYVLHWNGTEWSVAKTWPESPFNPEQLTGVTAISPSDVWVFGAPGENAGLGTWHLQRTTWSQVTGTGAGIAEASALSATNIWAVSSTSTSAQADTILNYDGSSWQQVTSLPSLDLTGIVALSATNIWASAQQAYPATGSVLVHYDGQSWQQIAVPWTLNVTGIATDGQGGLWLPAEQVSSGHWYTLHLSGTGTWSRKLLTTAPGEVGSLARIPGSRSVWAVGATPGSTGSDATVWARGAAG